MEKKAKPKKKVTEAKRRVSRKKKRELKLGRIFDDSLNAFEDQ